MDLVVYDDDDKRYVPWAVALAALLLVAVVVAGLTLVLARGASGDRAEQAVGGQGVPEPATAPSATAPSAAATSSAPSPEADGLTAASACRAALLQADVALQRSAAVEQALADHTAIMDELLAERITAQQALDRALPVLTDGATERRRLEEAVAAYRESRSACSS